MIRKFIELITITGDVKKIFAGELQVLSSEDLNLDLTRAGNQDNVSLFNFPVNNSFKVLPYFEKMNDKEILYYSDVCSVLLEAELWTDDFLGKMVIGVFSLLSMNSVIVSAAGLSNKSIDFFVECFSKYLEDRNDRILLMVI